MKSWTTNSLEKNTNKTHSNSYGSLQQRPENESKLDTVSRRFESWKLRGEIIEKFLIHQIANQHVVLVFAFSGSGSSASSRGSLSCGNSNWTKRKTSTSKKSKVFIALKSEKRTKTTRGVFRHFQNSKKSKLLWKRQQLRESTWIRKLKKLLEERK